MQNQKRRTFQAENSSREDLEVGTSLSCQIHGKWGATGSPNSKGIPRRVKVKDVCTLGQRWHRINPLGEAWGHDYHAQHCVSEKQRHDSQMLLENTSLLS